MSASTRRETQQDKVLAYLLTGHSLDLPKAMAMFGYIRLSDIIFKLRRKGHIIPCETFKGPEGNTLSFYTYAGFVGEGAVVKTKTDDSYNGRRGTVLRVDDGECLVKLRWEPEGVWFNRDELEPINA